MAYVEWFLPMKGSCCLAFNVSIGAYFPVSLSRPAAADENLGVETNVAFVAVWLGSSKLADAILAEEIRRCDIAGTHGLTVLTDLTEVGAESVDARELDRDKGSGTGIRYFGKIYINTVESQDDKLLDLALTDLDDSPEFQRILASDRAEVSLGARVILKIQTLPCYLDLL